MKYRLTPSALALAALLLSATRAPASTSLSDDPTAELLFDDLPVVLSASRLSQPISESPASMTIIDRDTIQASGAIDIPDVLRLVPGFQVSHISGANQTAQYHGIANQHAKRMQILIDGRSVYHAAFGGVHWDSLPITLEDIDRIEVLRGSNAASYGSNAFMGVVNIITRHAAQTHGTAVTLLGGYGGTREARLRFGDRIGTLDYRLSLDHFTTDGFPNTFDTHYYWDSTGVGVPPEAVLTGTPWLPKTGIYPVARNDSQTIQRINFRGDWLLDNGDTVLLELGQVRNDRDNALGNGLFELQFFDENLRTSAQLLKWSRFTPSLGDLSVRASHNRFRFDNRVINTLIHGTGGILLNFGPVLGGQKLRNDRYDIEFEHTPPGRESGWRLVWGAGMRLDTLRSSNFTPADQDLERLQYRLFLNTEKHLGSRRQWVINAGAMAEHQQDIGSFISPRLALNWHANDFDTLRIAISRAWRMPSFWEQASASRLQSLDASPLIPLGVIPRPFDYVLFAPAPTIPRPERLDTLELGFHHARWEKGVAFDARLFIERLRDYIDLVRHLDACTTCDNAGSVLPTLDPHDLLIHENAGWLDIRGLELHLRYAADDRTTLQGSLSLTHTRGERVKRRDAAGNLVLTTKIDDYVPRATFSTLLTHRFDHGWSGSLAYYVMSKMNWPNDGDRLDPYTRLDARIARRFTLAGHQGQLELIAQNLLGKPYIEFRDDNRFERRIFLRLRLGTP